MISLLTVANPYSPKMRGLQHNSALKIDRTNQTFGQKVIANKKKIKKIQIKYF